MVCIDYSQSYQKPKAPIRTDLSAIELNHTHYHKHTYHTDQEPIYTINKKNHNHVTLNDWQKQIIPWKSPTSVTPEAKFCRRRTPYYPNRRLSVTGVYLARCYSLSATWTCIVVGSEVTLLMLLWSLPIRPNTVHMWPIVIGQPFRSDYTCAGERCVAMQGHSGLFGAMYTSICNERGTNLKS